MLQVTDTEELAAAMQSRVVADGNFGHPESCNIEFSRHFHADDAATRFQSDSLKDLPSEEAEVAVDVAN